MSKSRIGAIAGTIILALGAQGCSGGSAQGPAAGFNGGGDCKATKAEMNKLVAQGVENDINAQASGRSLSSQARARVDRYNELLDSYLGGRCHV
ncbi:MAG: hypothetical protein R3D57_12130 [Hyphomicrobiaceae bacterium]